uniref:Uncharacterized protein n=2 Tax=Magallana gigas TaxID=29159 RepID=A0A8W8NWL7_MAGGI|nr:uncharacterized protein LOC105343433 [Crassostrea gigas]XP_034319387.1 uncharacterized protein LOC105343433 [Crassostrea gigas]
MDNMSASSRNETTLVSFEDIDAGFSIQDRVLLGALSTVGALVALALMLRFMKQPCKHRLDNKDSDKKEYDKFSSSLSLEDGSSDVSCKTSSSGFSESSGMSSQGTQISYCSSEFSLQSDQRSLSFSQSLPDLTGKNTKSFNILSPAVFALSSDYTKSSSQIIGKTDDYSSKEKDSIKSAENLDSLLSNSVMSLTSSLQTNDKRKATVEHAYGKFMPKYYKSIPEIDKSLDPAKL